MKALLIDCSLRHETSQSSCAPVSKRHGIVCSAVLHKTLTWARSHMFAVNRAALDRHGNPDAWGKKIP